MPLTDDEAITPLGFLELTCIMHEMREKYRERDHAK